MAAVVRGPCMLKHELKSVGGVTLFVVRVSYRRLRARDHRVVWSSFEFTRWLEKQIHAVKPAYPADKTLQLNKQAAEHITQTLLKF